MVLTHGLVTWVVDVLGNNGIVGRAEMNVIGPEDV